MPCRRGLLALFFVTAAFLFFKSFTGLLFTPRNWLCWHRDARLMVEEFTPLDGRFSPLLRKDLPSYRGRIYPPMVEGILASWKNFPG
jgi:hypothetical protein